VVTTLCQQRRSPVLRILQFNIHAAISGAGVVHVSQIAAEIEAVQPDLVSLNEVDSHTLRTRLDEPAYLAEATGLHVVYGPNLIYDGGPFGNAILTRFPVVESHNLRLPGTFGLEPRGPRWCMICPMIDLVGSGGDWSSISSDTDLEFNQRRRPGADHQL
jgi:endonuclease/exonuclease/phosphatase family metal-dependent hydrolase